MENRTERGKLSAKARESLVAPVPVEVVEFRDHYVVEVPSGGLDPDEVEFSVSSRIVTVRTTASGPATQRRPQRTIGSVFLDGPVDPTFSEVFYSRGKLYLKVRKDPSARTHIPFSVKVSG